MIYTMRKLIKLFFLPFGYVYQAISKSQNQVVILMYHRVNDHVQKELSVPVKNFKWQTNYLRKKRYNVISMDELVHRLETNTLSGKYVVITFDDGYADFYENAFPVLKEHHLPCIHYLATGFIDTDKVYWWDEDLEENQLMTWKQVEELNKEEIMSFGAHTVNHPDLDTIPEREMEEELIGGKTILEDRLKKAVIHFAYPRGRADERSIELVKRIYKTGALIFNGQPIKKENTSIDFSVLKRVPVQYSDGNILFIARLNDWLVIEELLRKIAKRLKK
ncbi:peptidoglycan/xylan/chitin deacetylase (PgdA/CDA1 family) [Bacillus mesophilus]|uniref:Polysaccharide deacetylase family protein n=1 Tax=Bacillus mesophilus TaxID=1808955 RepID=A0A6M0Q7L5_9BACI|nr:polysaccharide deacetylase family protein [Bacillus mesophilus]MBM7661646.1 peptidoglycan/xylan/chitin deacetylase (PgdA/CDA1 family) [Bacillus mesophilus]NEY72314.1 polysaccharide deacetylase family protein [Bacillus mesophilus]